jgi:tRNA-dihydrouridine synthase
MLEKGNHCQGIMIGRSGLGNYGIFYNLICQLRNKINSEPEPNSSSIIDFNNLKSFGNLTKELHNYFSILFSVIYKYSMGIRLDIAPLPNLSKYFFISLNNTMNARTNNFQRAMDLPIS